MGIIISIDHVISLISSIMVLSAAIVGLIGVNSWRKQLRGKRKFSITEDVLTAFYQASDIIRNMRYPVSSVEEGKSRPKSNDENEEQSEFMDRAYVVYVRYYKEKEFFSKLWALKYKVRALMGKGAIKPFEDLHTVINDILFAAHMLGKYYWPKTKRIEDPTELNKHYDNMNKREALLYFKYEDPDPIEARIDKIITDIENIVRKSDVKI